MLYRFCLEWGGVKQGRAIMRISHSKWSINKREQMKFSPKKIVLNTDAVVCFFFNHVSDLYRVWNNYSLHLKL